MANFNLNKTIYDKKAYEKTIDTSFSQVITPIPPTENVISVEEFFIIYDNIFYNIPIKGETNSHEYLIKTSGEYVGGEIINEDIQLLLDEITSLRQQLLSANQQITQLQISRSNSI